MLKKTGIVAAAATAGLLAVSPLAVAHGSGHHHHGDGRDGNSQRGLINLQNTNAQVPIQMCNNNLIEGVLGILAKDERNRDSHKGKCRQDNRADNGGRVHRGGGHHHHH